MSEIPEVSINQSSDSLAGDSALPYLQFASILLKGLEKLADIQKTTLDLYDSCAQQTQSATESMKEMFPAAPVHFFEMAEEAIRAFLQIQVRILDLMLKQTVAHVEVLKTNAPLDYDRNIARLMRSSADCLLEMQEKAVEFISQQNQTFAAEMSRYGGHDGTDGVPAIQPGTDAIIQAQKTFWDVTLKPFRMWQAEMAQTGQGFFAGQP